MSGSDTRQQPKDRTLQFAGTGQFASTRCGKCSRPIGVWGSRMVMHLGAKIRVGRCCVKKAGEA
jgi:hypothetical protein